MSVSLRVVDIAFKDFIYKQNPNNSYIFNPDGSFQREDLDAVIDAILLVLKNSYAKIIQAKGINPGKMVCNEPLLAKALARNSRDIFGASRLSARIERLKKTGSITETHRAQLMQFSDYGLKTDSRIRKLSRSSLEFFLGGHVKKISSPHNNTVYKFRISELPAATR
jgi:hypothetical protein